MDDPAATRGRLPAAVSFLLGSVGLGWILMVMQTSAGHEAGAAGEAQQRVEMTAASETAPVFARPDGRGQQPVTVMSRED
jgi:hypothetical protein